MDATSAAERIPAGWQAENFRPIGYNDLGGRRGAFKIAITEKNGRWYLFLGHLWHQGWSIVDVTDPDVPRLVKFIPGPANTWTIQVTLHGNLMLTALQRVSPAWGGDPAHPFEEGVILWDIEDPENPRELSRWLTGSTGTHRNIYPGGDYAYLSAALPGFSSRLLVTLDVRDPRNPKEAGRFWLPGQKDGEAPPAGAPVGFHGPLNISTDGRTGYLGYAPAVLVLDTADKAAMKIVGRLDMVPPFGDAHAGPQSLHTVLPVPGRELLIVSSEAHEEGCDKEPYNYVALIDIRDPAHPRLQSFFPEPVPPAGAAFSHYCEKGGRFGPHNTNQELHNPFVEARGDIVYYTWFNAGLRAFDIRDARRLVETGWFVPPVPDRRAGPMPRTALVTQTEDVAVDARGNVFITDKQWGLFILRYEGVAA